MADSPDEWSSWLDRHGPALILLARQWVGGELTHRWRRPHGLVQIHGLTIAQQRA